MKFVPVDLTAHRKLIKSSLFKSLHLAIYKNAQSIIVSMILIRKAKTYETRKIANLEKKVWKAFLGLTDVAGKYDVAAFIRFGHVFVAVDNKKIIGVIVAMETKDKKVFIVDWVVDEKYRGRKIGSKLYKRLISVTKNQPILTLISPDYSASIKAHKEMGFRIRSRVKDPYGIGEKAVYYCFEKK